MAIKIGANFSYNGPNFLDARQSFATLEEMKNCLLVPDGFITYCQEDEKRYEFKSSNTIDELTGKWREFVVNAEIPDIEIPEIEIPEPKDCFYLGADEPEDNNKIWFFTNKESNSSEITYDNPLIAELFSCIQSLQSQITQLQAEVEYLKLNGGGGLPIEPGDKPGIGEITEDIIFTLEDGGLFLLEDDSGYLIMEETIKVSNEDVLILEDGTSLLLEDGSFILLESVVVNEETKKDNLVLLESGEEMLLESGKNILLEN